MQTLNNTPTEIEWRVYRGDSSSLTILLKDDQGKIVRDAQGVLCLARRYPQDAEVLCLLNSYFGTVPPQNNQGDASSGVITIEIPWQRLIYPTDNQGNPIDPTQVAQPHAWGKEFYFDVQIYISGKTQTILKVKVNVETDISRGEGFNNGN